MTLKTKTRPCSSRPVWFLCCSLSQSPPTPLFFSLEETDAPGPARFFQNPPCPENNPPSQLAFTLHSVASKTRTPAGEARAWSRKAPCVREIRCSQDSRSWLAAAGLALGNVLDFPARLRPNTRTLAIARWGTCAPLPPPTPPMGGKSRTHRVLAHARSPCDNCIFSSQRLNPGQPTAA
jgi:hypothetical protein